MCVVFKSIPPQNKQEYGGEGWTPIWTARHISEAEDATGQPARPDTCQRGPRGGCRVGREGEKVSHPPATHPFPNHGSTCKKGLWR